MVAPQNPLGSLLFLLTPPLSFMGAPPGAATGLELFGAVLQPGFPSASSLNAARGRAAAGCSPPQAPILPPCSKALANCLSPPESGW